MTVRPRYSVSTAASAALEPVRDVVDDRRLALHLRAVGGCLGGHGVPLRSALGRRPRRSRDRAAGAASQASPLPAGPACPLPRCESRPEVFGVRVKRACVAAGTVAASPRRGSAAASRQSSQSAHRATAGARRAGHAVRLCRRSTRIRCDESFRQNRRALGQAVTANSSATNASDESAATVDRGVGFGGREIAMGSANRDWIWRP